MIKNWTLSFNFSTLTFVKMYLTLFQRVFTLAFLASVFTAEPHCSNFHFQEKMLEKIVRMELKMSSLREDISELRDRMSAVEKSQDMVVTPTVAFIARGPNNLSPLDNQLIVFTKTLMNHGNGYDHLTGVFTTPHGGTYLFMTQFCIRHGSRHIYSAIVYEDVVVKGSLLHDNNSDFCVSADTIVVMEKGERVWIKCVGTSSKSSDVLREDGKTWNTFTGVLLHK